VCLTTRSSRPAHHPRGRASVFPTVRRRPRAFGLRGRPLNASVRCHCGHRMIETSCHCGSLSVRVPRKPRSITQCNCSICRRYGALWAYYRASEVQVRGKRGSTSSYIWGDGTIRFVRCRHCGCVTHWAAAAKSAAGRIGVNMRNADPDVLGAVRIRHFDGSSM